MNEQTILHIQHLAEQADNFTIDKFNTALHFPDPKEWQRIRDSIFAKLIAIECADIAMSKHTSKSFDDLDKYDRGCDDTASSIGGSIKFRFGVIK